MPSGRVVAPATVAPAMTVKLDIAALLDERPLGPLQARVLAFCFTILLIDGFDTQAIGYVAPALIHDMGIASATLGSLFTAGIVGMAIGSLGFGLAADRIGRRAALIGSLVVFGVFTLGKSLAQSFELLVGLQFLAGLGLGGAYPNAVALMAEYAPRRIRNTLVVVGACGYLLGSSVGGFIATWLIPLHGWQAVFQLGGVLPLVLSLVLAAALPDSLRFLASRNGRSAEARAILRRIAPGLDLAADAVLITPEHRPGGFPVAALFREGRAGMTLLLWLAHFMNLAVAFFTFSWLPTLFRSAGVSMQQSLLAATALPLGAVLGAIFIVMIDPFLTYLKDDMPGIVGNLAATLGAGSAQASHIQDNVAAIASANGLKGAIYGVIIVLFVLFEPLGLYGRWLKIKLFFQLFPLYKRATFKRQKIYVKSERNR
jgi:AAHS family 4-hydroxybenzoate transporter-like MFS transporter